MRRRDAMGVMAGGLLWARCGGGSPSPTPPPPTPTPDPTPTPPLGGGVTFPLGVIGHQFVDGNRSLLHRWAVWHCCGHKAESGWPLVRRGDGGCCDEDVPHSMLLPGDVSANANEETVRRYIEYGCNWTGVRVGPFSHSSPDAEVAPDRQLWPRLATYMDVCRRTQSVAEVDVLDGWALRRGYSYYRWDCGITARPPDQQQLNWVRQVLANTDFPHVVYQVSNESFLCKEQRPEWELGIIAEIRRLRPDALIATNSGLRRVQEAADIITSHERYAQPIHDGKPTVVNEHNPVESAFRWEEQARVALSIGSVFDLWRGELDDAQWQEALERMKRLRLEVEAAS